MFASRCLSILFIIKMSYYLRFVQGQLEEGRQLRYSVGLSEPLQSTLDWDYEGNDKLIFQWIIVLPNGYSGILAFSNYDLDTNHADVIIFGEDKKLYNAYTNNRSLLSLSDDNVQLDYRLIKSEKIGNGIKKKLTIRFIRPFDTCDEERRNYIIDRGTIHLLTGLMTRDDFKNIKRGNLTKLDVNSMDLTLQRVQLLKSQAKFPSIPDADPHLDFLNTKVTIPNEETTYWCTRFEIPAAIMKQTHHIIRFDGIVSPQSEGVVHHMELFHCDVDPDTEIPEFNGACTSEQKPMGLKPCRRVIGAWAMGAANFIYPEEAGGVFGGLGTSRFVILEVHFNNPYLKKGIIDQSGIRIYYTSKLRKYDAAIMEVGLEYTAKNSIPPRSNAFRISGYCNKECTQAALPKKGITVFASQLHTHLTGVEVFTRIIKNDGRIEILNADQHYSPHFQEIRLLPKPIKIERGDTILHTCIFNTETRPNMTFGGYGIRDEMCVNYMHYYPRSILELCKTSVTDDALDKFFETMKEYDRAETSRDLTVLENYSAIRWTPLTSAILQEFYEIAPIHLSCNSSDGNYSPKFDSSREYRPYEPKQRDVPSDTAAECK